MCLPGAGINKVASRLDTWDQTHCYSWRWVESKVGSEKLFRRFQQDVVKVRSKSVIPVVCGVLQRRGLRAEWLSRAIVMNCRLANHCNGNGWIFIGNWDIFYIKDTLYAGNGVHFTSSRCLSSG